jgi:hypothetical protein
VVDVVARVWNDSRVRADDAIGITAIKLTAVTAIIRIV